MIMKQMLLSSLLINLIFLTSCDQNVSSITTSADTIFSEEPQKSNRPDQHPYGGWYCPDNVLGFPAVNIEELDKVPVVKDRLPTREETQNGTSLIYIDQAKFPDARPLEIHLPQLARYYNGHTKKNELVILIQALVVNQDSIVGFRYLNGGNGSAWLDEVSFLTDQEVGNLGSTPFVSLSSSIDAGREEIWKIITDPRNDMTLGKMFDESESNETDWRKSSNVNLKYAADGVVPDGIMTSHWENMYIQVDYDLNGSHYVEKFLLLESPQTKKTEFHLVTGPFKKDFEAQKSSWEDWLEKVIVLSER